MFGMSWRACGLGALLLAAGIGNAPAADLFEDVREYIRAELAAQSIPSVAVAVARDGRILWEEGFGWADRERRIPATEHTIYSLASSSKAVTATALMTLVQAGKVALDAPANTYLSDTAHLRARIGDARDATVRRLANHTAGLPGHFQAFYADEPHVAPSMDETIRRYGFVMRPPSERYRYSNIGYGVIGHLIERVTAQRIADFMRREVFLPLGLTRTSVGVELRLGSGVAVAYDEDGSPLAAYGVDSPGATSVFSTAHDLVRFGLFHLKARQADQKAILTDASLDEMHRPTVFRDHKGRDRGYGVGFIVHHPNGHRMVWHSGGMPGASTQMLLFPDAKLAIVVLSNARSGLADSVADRIAAKLLRGWKLDADQAKPAPAPFVATPAFLGTWNGTLTTYDGEQSLVIHFASEGDIHVKLGNQPTVVLDDAEVLDGVLSGGLAARVGTADSERSLYASSLELDLRGNRLTGALCVFSRRPGGSERYSLWHWVELTRGKQGLPEN